MPTSGRGKGTEERDGSVSLAASAPSQAKLQSKSQRRSREEINLKKKEMIKDNMATKQLQQRGNAVRLQRLHR
jgi:hypothetical protein